MKIDYPISYHNLKNFIDENYQYKAEFIRDFALYNEGLCPELSVFLMEYAEKHIPNGPLISFKAKEYRERNNSLENKLELLIKTRFLCLCLILAMLHLS
jgi:ATP/ADP translocase